MASGPIQFFNRYSGRLETESVYGDRFLRWTYGNPLGRLALHALVKRTIFSRWYGWRMDAARSRAKIAPFIAQYGVDPGEFAEAPESYRTFNEFFYRKLKPSARPVDPHPAAAVFPGDGRHLGFPDVSMRAGFQVKGVVFDLVRLLDDDALAARFQQGTLILSRLCPVDCHRFHFPVGGVPDWPRLINGSLLSVNPVAQRKFPGVFMENKRALTRIESTEFGLVLMLEVGATCVGSFEYTFAPGRPVAKGVEKGYFRFGGSAIITLFERGRLQLAGDLLEQSARQVELYARLGDRMGSRGDGNPAITCQ
jgi:phosphatidylserine decarboxylase